MQIVLQERLLEENNSPAPRDLADLVFREPSVAANEPKRISAMHEYYLCVCTRRPSTYVSRLACFVRGIYVESTTDHHVPCTGKRLDLAVLPAVC